MCKIGTVKSDKQIFFWISDITQMCLKSKHYCMDYRYNLIKHLFRKLALF